MVVVNKFTKKILYADRPNLGWVGDELFSILCKVSDGKINGKNIYHRLKIQRVSPNEITYVASYKLKRPKRKIAPPPPLPVKKGEEI